MDTKNAIVIDLENSSYAHGFKSENMIHQLDIDKADEIICKQLNQIREQDEDGDGVILHHKYNTIAVFGDRGSGKTSFLISLLEKYRNERDDVEVLRIIDPTLVEHKRPIVLCVISMINQLVDNVIRNQECSSEGIAYEQRRKWSSVLKKVSMGVFAIDNVGKDYNDSLWQDEEYVLNTGLCKVRQADDFEKNIRQMIRVALSILNKKAFILAFDDIDVDVEQGWKVLETLRRYLSYERIISIVSGNIKLYGMIVRHELCKNLTISNNLSKDTMENELESQYMLKLLEPSNRINMLSLYNIVHSGNYNVYIKTNDIGKEELLEVYSDILTFFGIPDKSTQGIFIEFLLSMSLRSQINFIKDSATQKDCILPISVFSSRLYASDIDIDTLLRNSQMTNISILNYLTTRAILSDNYLLLPTSKDKDTNSNLTALALLECKHFKQTPACIVDYMLRIGYIRNVILSLEDKNKIADFCRYSGWNQMMSLKNNIGLTMAYEKGKGISDLKGHIPLFAMENKMKQVGETVENALDKALKEEQNPCVKLMASFPFIRISQSSNNESRSYYSFVALLAVVGELLKAEDKEGMISRINDLKLFRSYQMPQDVSRIVSESEIKAETFGVEIETKEIKTLANSMQKWKKVRGQAFLPPYALGRIMTRFYTSVLNIEISTVGQMMNIMVANLFNACLIEETNTRKPNGYEEINNNNLRSDTKILKNNIGKKNVIKELNFTKWMISCPMLNCFLDNETYEKIEEFIYDDLKKIRESYPVYELLNKIKSKVTDRDDYEKKTSFLGKRNNGWKNSRDILLRNGINIADIKKQIIEADIDSAISYINNTDLFSGVNQKSVIAFRTNFKDV